MFGDPVRNSRGLPTLRLDKMAMVGRGKFTPRPRNDPRYYGGTYPFIQTGNIASSDCYLKSWSQTLNEAGVGVSKKFPKEHRCCYCWLQRLEKLHSRFD
jgi:type I restriction enzyme S subunit